ncbi:transporter [Inhella proteolytica]|uniref:Transporter n=1 Tax=Inhella proteolytica TaxID=2795029 RepID=A0A931JA55_9BURK|nr:transporter [Inhella proteolytica]MBH9579627.1 transporter [Inhella proteolytica]
MRLLALIAACAPLLTAPPAAAEEALATDRPDVVESAEVVGRGRVQLEASLAGERNRQAGVTTQVWSTPFLLRLGVSDTVELRLESDGRQRLRLSGAETGRASGWSDAAVGLKWHSQDGDDASGRPALAWLLHLDLDSGSAALRGQGLRPSLRLVAEWELPQGLSLGVMPGLLQERNEAGRRYTAASLAVVMGRSLTEDWRVFGELAAHQLASSRNGGSVLTLNAGTAWLLSPNAQLDLALSRGLNRYSPDWGWTLGLSLRF